MRSRSGNLDAWWSVDAARQRTPYVEKSVYLYRQASAILYPHGHDISTFVGRSILATS